MKKIVYLIIIISITACESNLPEINQNANNPKPTNSINYTFTGIIENSEEEWYSSNTKQTNTIEIQDFSNIDSIVFQAGLRTPEGNVKCYLELYDLEDSVSIYGSELENTIPYFVILKQSEDLSYYFKENKRYRLAVRIKSEKAGISVQSGYTSYLIIYRE